MQGPYLREYGQPTTIYFNLVQVDGVDLRVDAVVSATDIFLEADGSAVAATNNATDMGRGYSLALTTAEMTHANIVIHLEDQSGTKVWLDDSIVIETYGNGSGQHAFNFNSNNVLSSNTIAEQGVGAPPAAPTAEQILSYIYMQDIRNRVVTTSTSAEMQIFADDGTTKVFVKGYTDSAGIFTRNEATSG